MLEFLEAANQQTAAKRNELLSPILNQEKEILTAIDQSYQNLINANATLTAYLVSVRKVKTKHCIKQYANLSSAKTIRIR